MSHHDRPTRPDEEVLAAVRQRGQRLRRRRQVALTSAAIAVVALVAVPVLAEGGSQTEVIAGRGATSEEPTTTTEPDTTATTGEPAEDPTAASSDDPNPGDGDKQPEPTTTTAVLVCRNSSDPRCGDFYYDPEPDPNQPLTITVTVEPAVPVAGQEVVFTVEVEDPDAEPLPNDCRQEVWFGDEEFRSTTCPVHYHCLDRTGPWDPPEKRPYRDVHEFRHVYEESDTYTVTFVFRTGTPCDNHYGDEAREDVEVFVAPRPDA